MATKTWLFPIRVYHQDTDLMGIVHHGKYLDFFERARAEVLRDIGIKLPYILEHEGFQFAVAELKVKYIAPACLDDELLMRTTVDKIDKYSIHFKQEALLNLNNTILTKALVRVVTLNHNKKLTIVPQNIIRGLTT